MKKSYLIADSGGTKTDWCFVDINGKKNYFTTASYHPNLMSEDWIESQKFFWEEYANLKDLEVHFYGSGCLREPNKSKVKKVFEFWGFTNITIESDILAAARVCFGNENGWVGILGTGAVLAEIENQQVKNIYGGLGYLNGDEGSGFYFGKLLIEKYRNNEFSKETLVEIAEVLDFEILNALKSNNELNKDFISSLSSIFSKTKNQEIKHLHQENIALFFDNYLPLTEPNTTICFVGSYAEFNRIVIQDYLHKRHLKLGIVISRPITFLAEYTLKGTL